MGNHATSLRAAMLGMLVLFLVCAIYAIPSGAVPFGASSAARRGLPAGAGPSLTDGVTIAIEPPSRQAQPEDVFVVDIVVSAGSQLVDGAQASISFDPAILTVVDAQGNPANQITEGSAFSTHLMNTVDNTSGRIFYADGQLSGDPLNGTIALATIRFKAISEGQSAVTFILNATPQTKVTLQEANVLTAAQNGSVTVGEGSEPTATATTLPQETATPTATATVPVGGPSLALDPASAEKMVGETFLVQIIAATGAQAVDGAQVFIDFDPTRLAVVDADGNPVSSIIPGSAFDVVILNSVDNAAGRIDFAAGQLSGSPPSGLLSVATIRFKALAVASDATVHISTGAPRASKLTYQGANVLAQTSDGHYAILGPVTATPTATVTQRPTHTLTPTWTPTATPTTVPEETPTTTATVLPPNTPTATVTAPAVETRTETPVGSWIFLPVILMDR